MNTVILTGNLCKDNELRFTKTGTAILENTIGVRREMKNQYGEYESDFVNLTMFGTTAEFVQKYSKKGDKISVTGKIRVDNYKDNDGNTKYRNYVRVNSVELLTPHKERNDN